MNDDLISRAAAIDALDEQIKFCDNALCDFNISLKDEYAVKVERASLCAYKEILEDLPSAQTELSEIKRDLSDLISRQDAIDTLWEIRREEIIDGRRFENHCSLSTAVDVIRDLPSAQTDLSGYSSRLWKAAYERGKAEAQAEIIHCGECKYYHDSDGCFFSTATTRADGFCHWAERKEGEADG
jgi:hypothetical protein